MPITPSPRILKALAEALGEASTRTGKAGAEFIQNLVRGLGESPGIAQGLSAVRARLRPGPGMADALQAASEALIQGKSINEAVTAANAAQRAASGAASTLGHTSKPPPTISAELPVNLDPQRFQEGLKLLFRGADPAEIKAARAYALGEETPDITRTLSRMRQHIGTEPPQPTSQAMKRGEGPIQFEKTTEQKVFRGTPEEYLARLMERGKIGNRTPEELRTAWEQLTSQPVPPATGTLYRGGLGGAPAPTSTTRIPTTASEAIGTVPQPSYDPGRVPPSVQMTPEEIQSPEVQALWRRIIFGKE